MKIEQKVAPKVIPSKVVSPTAKRTTMVKKQPVNSAATIKIPVATAIAGNQVIEKRIMNADKSVKLNKVKMERDSFTMPKDEYAQLAALKARLLALGKPVKKSELLRAGIKHLVAMTDLRLKKAMADVPVIKAGRPKKKE
jgi:hypothetical protein